MFFLSTDLTVRLSGPNATNAEGIIEVYLNGDWWAVSGQMMTKETADVFCRQLGHLKAKHFKLSNVDENAEITVALFEFFCSGNESKCSECRFVTLLQVDIKYQFYQKATMLYCETTEKIPNASKYQYEFVNVCLYKIYVCIYV